MVQRTSSSNRIGSRDLTPTLARRCLELTRAGLVRENLKPLGGRCIYGPGIQIWEHSNKGGRTEIFCGTRMYIADLWGKREQIQGDRWAGRLSSFETFHTNEAVPRALG
jgi:hypothetical protein